MRPRRGPVTPQRFFRHALLLPIVLPLLLAPFLALGGPDLGLLGAIAGHLVFGSLVGLVPYAAVAARLFAWSDRATEDDLRRLAWESCALMMLETGAFVLLATWSVAAALGMAACAAVYSAAYVALARGLLVLGRAAGLVAPRERLAPSHA